jgi:hypothetical protein
MYRVCLTAFVLLGIALFGTVPAAGQDDPENPRTVGMLDTEGISTSVMRAARRGITGPDGTGKNGPLVKIGSELALLYEQQQAAGAAGVRSIREQSVQPIAKRQEDVGQIRSRVQSPISPDGEAVSVNAIAVDETDRLHAELRRLGLENGASAGDVVSGKLPIEALGDAAQLDALQGMLPAHVRTHIGSVGSEADTSHATVAVRETRNLDGSGQKICALSDSYDARGQASRDIQSGDLPGPGNPEGNTSPVDVVQEGGADGSDEGRAMLQLIHDIAPGAELGFHTAFGGIGIFAQGIRDLADAGCTVIVDDVGYNIEPFYQDGPVSNAVDEVVQKEGIPYFSSAGNDGQNSYEAPFRDSGEPGVLNSSSDAHDFDPSSGTDTRQEITLEAGGNFRIFSFQWTDPSSIVDGSDGADTDIDVALVDETGTIVAESIGNNIETGVPLESIDYTNETGSAQTLDLVIEKAGGPDPEEVKYVYSGSGYAIQEYDTLGPTVYGHPMAEGAMAVAAAPFFFTSAYDSDADPAILESFSSKGGIPLLFNQDGSRRATPKVRQKPDVTGTDGIDNTFFGSDISDTALGGVDPDPHPNFFGTSAAAPNVAAIGALIRQARPGLAPAGVYDRLESTAADVTERADRTNTLQQIGSGRDPWSGAGFVQGPDAVPDPVLTGLQATAENSRSGAVTLSWEVDPGVSIQNYKVQRRYFNGQFEAVKSVDAPPVRLEGLGLGVFSFRVRWTRADGTQGTSVIATDTLNVQELSATEGMKDESGRRPVELSWSTPQGTKGFTYRIERQKGRQGPFESVGTTDRTSFRAERQVPGKYNYRVVSIDEQGNSLTSQAESKQIEFEESAFALGPYPNPVRSTATLDVTAQTGQSVTIEVYDALGRRLYQDRRDLEALTPATLTVDASRWSSGTYFLRVSGNEFTKTRKMVVVR